MSERSETHRGLFLIAVGAFFFVLTGWAVVIAMDNDDRARASSDWPTVKGQVTTYEYRRVRRSAAEMDRDPGPANARKEYNDVLDWEYAYTVDGTRYTSRRYGWVGRDGRSNFVSGTEVTVYYDPEDPSTAVLNTDAESTVSLAGILFGLAMGGYCAHSGVTVLRRARAAEASA